MLSVTAAAMLCGILGSIIGKRFAGIGKLLLGLSMVVVLIKPLMKLDLQTVLPDLDAFSAAGDPWIAEGKAAADASVDALIQKEITAYIEEKAAAMGAKLTVIPRIQDGVPVEISITGERAPYVQTRLSKWLEDTMGILQEAQIWN